MPINRPIRYFRPLVSQDRSLAGGYCPRWEPLGNILITFRNVLSQRVDHNYSMSLNLLKQKSRWISRAVGVLKTPLSPASIPARRASCPTRNNLDLTNRVALVTGGTNGIGFEIAKRLGKNGATVVVSSRTQENVDRAVDKLHSSGLKQVRLYSKSVLADGFKPGVGELRPESLDKMRSKIRIYAVT